jgi:hypothetical protein
MTRSQISMTSIRIAVLLVGGLLIGAQSAVSETAECRMKLKQQEEQCQVLAEKRAAACPGESATHSAACKQLSADIANSCTRKPCAPPPRKGKRKKGGMGMTAPKKSG